MPSLHFATSLMAAHLLAEAGPLPGAVGWTYAVMLGFALVYLGEHYVVDLLAGTVLTQGIRRAAPRLAPAARRLTRALQRLERAAHA
jgi:membrane-associated phospholipid phosphatase